MTQSRRDHGSWAAGGASKPTAREVCSADTASISLRAEDSSHSGEAPRCGQTTGLAEAEERAPMPGAHPQGPESAASSLREVLSWVASQLESVLSCMEGQAGRLLCERGCLQVGMHPGSCGNSSRHGGCPRARGHRDPDFPFQRPHGRTSVAFFQQGTPEAGEGGWSPSRGLGKGLRAVQVRWRRPGPPVSAELL